MGMNFFVFLFLPYLRWLFLRMFGLRMCEGAMRMGKVGARFFLDRLMIGSWMRFAVFLWP